MSKFGSRSGPTVQSVGPDLGQNCLQRLSAEDKSHSCLFMFFLQQACKQLKVDIITLNVTESLSFHLKRPTINAVC